MATQNPQDELTTVHLLRHGEVHNPDGVLYGRLPNFHLSDRGRMMAARIAEHLAGNAVTVVVASPLDRARETAEPIAVEHGVAVDVDDRLIEASNVFEGLTFGVGDGALTRPTHWKHLRNPFRPSWGEQYTEQARRMLGAMADARDRARGAEAVLVSHQLPIWVARSAVEGRRLWHDPRRRECSVASLTSFTYADNAIVAVAYTEPARDLLPEGKRTVPGA
jgi:broad specificity phosphatase PhoE